MPSLRRCVPILLASIVSAPAVSWAQTSVPALPASAKHSCVKPDDHPGRLASDNQRRAWTRQVNNYLNCLKAYVADQQAAAKPFQDAAKVHIDAANAAIEEYNSSAKAFREQQDQADAK
jgi:hypothetical protein